VQALRKGSFSEKERGLHVSRERCHCAKNIHANQKKGEKGIRQKQNREASEMEGDEDRGLRKDMTTRLMYALSNGGDDF